MPDESRSERRRITDNPFLTVTGPLGAGGLGLAMMIFNIQADLKGAIASQQELRDSVVELAADVKVLTQTANGNTAGMADMRTQLRDLRSRVDRLEAESSSPVKRKR